MTQAEQVLDALGDSTRRQIIDILRESPAPVRAISDRLPVSRPAVSRHLRLLKEAGLVIDEARGTRRIYRLDSSGLDALREYLDSMWQNSLRGFAQTAEAEDGTS